MILRKNVKIPIIVHLFLESFQEFRLKSKISQHICVWINRLITKLSVVLKHSSMYISSVQSVVPATPMVS